MTLRVDAVDPSQRARFEDERFEVMIYLDGHFLFEDEDAVLPFHFPLDLSLFSAGDHTLLANVGTYRDHCAAAFFTFRVETP